MSTDSLASENQVGILTPSLPSRGPSSRVSRALPTPSPPLCSAVRGCFPESAVRGQGDGRKGVRRAARGFHAAVPMQSLSACRRRGPPGWASSKQGKGKRWEEALMDRGERKPKRWRWKCITGAGWLLPTESSSMESFSGSEISEDAGVGHERGQRGVSAAGDPLLWGCWALPSVGCVPSSESSLALVA